MSVRTWIRVLSVGVLMFFVAACSDNETSGDKKKGGDTQEIRITHQDETLVSNINVTSVNTFWFDDGNEFRTTVMGGWVNAETAAFGAVTLRIALQGAEGQPVGPGVYTLHSDDGLGNGPMTGHLSLSGVEMERVEDIGGIVDRIVAYDGTLEVKAIDGAGPNTLERLEFDFDGNFGKPDLPEESAKDELLPFSGQVRLEKK